MVSCFGFALSGLEISGSFDGGTIRIPVRV